MNIRELRANLPTVVRRVADTGEPQLVTYHFKPRAQIVSQSWFERAEQALAEKEARESGASMT